jgi:hypothetical protein
MSTIAIAPIARIGNALSMLIVGDTTAPAGVAATVGDGRGLKRLAIAEVSEEATLGALDTLVNGACVELAVGVKFTPGRFSTAKRPASVELDPAGRIVAVSLGSATPAGRPVVGSIKSPLSLPPSSPSQPS